VARNARASSRATRPGTDASYAARNSFARPVKEVAPERTSRSVRLTGPVASLPGSLDLYPAAGDLVRAGIPLEESLLACNSRTEKPRVRASFGFEPGDGGHRSRLACQSFRGFPEIIARPSAPRGGNSSGKLDGILERLADYTEGSELIRQKILARDAVPDSVLSLMCFAIVCG